MGAPMKDGKTAKRRNAAQRGKSSKAGKSAKQCDELSEAGAGGPVSVCWRTLRVRGKRQGQREHGSTFLQIPILLGLGTGASATHTESSSTPTLCWEDSPGPGPFTGGTRGFRDRPECSCKTARRRGRHNPEHEGHHPL